MCIRPQEVSCFCDSISYEIKKDESRRRIQRGEKSQKNGKKGVIQLQISENMMEKLKKYELDIRNQRGRRNRYDYSVRPNSKSHFS